MKKHLLIAAVSLSLFPLYIADTALAKDSAECDQCIRGATKLFAAGKNSDAAALLEKEAANCKTSERLHLLLSTILMRIPQRTDDATKAAETAVKINPSSLAANLQLGICLMATGDRESATAAFERAVDSDPSSYEAWSALGTLYSDLGNRQESEKCARKAACLEPGSREAKLRVVRSLQRQGRMDALGRELDRMLADDQLEPEFFVILSREALHVGAYKKSIKACDKALAAYPDSAQLRKTKAEALLWSRQYEAARKTLDEAGKGLNSDPEANAIKAVALINMGNVAKAEELVSMRPSTKNDSSVILLARGLLANRKGTTQAALKSFRATLAEDQLFIPGHVELARVYLHRQNTDKAQEEAREIQRNPVFKSTGKAMEARAALLGAPAREKMETARTLAKEAIAADGKDPDALVAMGLCSLKAGQVETAKQYIDSAYKIAPGNLDALLAVAELSRNDGNDGKAIRALENARIQAPTNGEIILTLAEVLLKKGDRSTVMKYLREANDVNGSDPNIAFAMALAQEAKGSDKDASRWYKESLTRGIGGPRATKARAAIRRLSGDVTEKL